MASRDVTSAGVSDAVIWAALRDVLSDPNPDLLRQWVGVADYAASRGSDPWRHRALVLAEMIGCPSDVGAALSAASVAVLDPGATALRLQFVDWMREDVSSAAPLLGVFTGHSTDVEHRVVLVGEDERGRLERWLGEQTAGQVSVTRTEVIGGGFSRRMWRVWIESASQSRRVIVRIEQGGMFGTDTPTEVDAMRALWVAGFPIPEVEFVELTGTVLGQPFFVMEEVNGQVRLDDDGIDDVIRSVSALHAVPATVLDSRTRSAEEVVVDCVDGWRDLYRAHSPIPIPLLEHAAQWLRQNLRPTGPSVIVHGDAGPGNALFHAGRGLTMLDWEFAHVGDAAEDWTYLALIRGRRIMDAESWKARLRSVAGVELTTDQWHAWLTFSLFRGACVNLTARTVFEAGPNRTADQLAIGVAVHLRFLAQLVDITCAP